jgi:23S rRNA pseudouridine2605 synthase
MSQHRHRDRNHSGPPRRQGSKPRPQKAQDRPGTAERLQKVLAQAGLGSRRACEELILQGRVTVDGKVIRELGTRADPHASQIAVDGQRIQPERHVYFAVHKPKGYVSTNSDPAGRPRVVDLLPEIPQRVYTVGRLDESSTGLMILTNDGELANKLAHPTFGVSKVYRAVVAGAPTSDTLTQLTQGVWLAEGKVRAQKVRVVGTRGDATILELVLAEGKNREVRRMLAKFGHKVMSLTRNAVGSITLRGLKLGACRPLTSFEVNQLRRVADGIEVPSQDRTERHSSRPPHRRRPERSSHKEPKPAPRSHATGRPGRSTPPRPRPPFKAPPPPAEPLTRRIIGLERGSEQPEPRRRRPPTHRATPGRHPRAALGPRRRPPAQDENNE